MGTYINRFSAAGPHTELFRILQRVKMFEHRAPQITLFASLLCNHDKSASGTQKPSLTVLRGGVAGRGGSSRADDTKQFKSGTPLPREQK
ncbi:hypothetical protein E2C01_055767 [Portunus trituberculatus]|uniref:Uncharacterized protein n=1 Tax=Portunus trituberculatus TaxID=210409 RepID=A0A5B7GS58_PORTR|nr:hypothetical protein [Portunus trituberculatus]